MGRACRQPNEPELTHAWGVERLPLGKIPKDHCDQKSIKIGPRSCGKKAGHADAAGGTDGADAEGTDGGEDEDGARARVLGPAGVAVSAAASSLAPPAPQ